MNSDTRKKLIRLIFPVLILLVMVVLIIMARARDARALQAALDAQTAKTENSSTETGETSASTGTETSVEESSDTYTWTLGQYSGGINGYPKHNSLYAKTISIIDVPILNLI